MPIKSIGPAAHSATEHPKVVEYEIRDLEPEDCLIEVQYCGICHSDIHACRSEWGPARYPLVAGHEFTGIVKEVGPQVTKYKVGDKIAIGCMVDSCLKCKYCESDRQFACTSGVTWTYGMTRQQGDLTQGGYGKYVVCRQQFLIPFPDNLPMDKGAPLLCAGITTWSPLVRHGCQKGGKKVGVVGLGGLGHMAVQFAAKFGNEVSVISRSPKKEELAKQLGATRLVVSENAEDMKKYHGYFDIMIDTVSAPKDMNAYIQLIACDGKMVCVGMPPMTEQMNVSPTHLIMGRRGIEGSQIGGLQETADMLKYCGEHQILPMVEMIKADQVGEAWDRTCKSDVLFRFVIDVKGSY